MEKSLFPKPSPYGLFRECWIHIKSENVEVIPFEEMNEHCKILYFQLKLHGANMCKSIDDSTTHIIIPSGYEMSEKDYESMAELNTRNIHILTEKWTQDSIKENKLLNEEDYKINKKSEDSSDESLFSF
ncbi:hypothetical protein AVEN_184266-1 [Araneus ventricosus]|uniref:BRCT domain-containing protein n=1 Tax=Araneus ventricosus TaxID=182803 RepID=A0A4Y2Q952_ARAVE|nr:hypothetical protein AVEN_184266-1 [Araneus ventricosus]